MTSLDELRWRAVEQRDRSRDGSFVYAVRTTGVYCRPGCGARRPLLCNVELFDHSGDAERSGYRPCKRCRPDAVGVPEPSVVAVIAVCRELDDPRGEHDLGALARSLGRSERHLRRRFGEVVGVSVASYRRARQAARARAALQRSSAVTDALYEAGYGSSRAFYEHGATRLGMPASRYRQGGVDERITYTSVTTPLGVVIAARTVRGVCAVRIGDDVDSSVAELAAEFRAARLERDDAGMAEVAWAIAAAARGDASEAAQLPLDLAGTAFQVRVWEALRSIPAGETRSYGAVATEMDHHGAARAVGSACGANPVALLVPCHRVVRADGSPGGYRWGLARKAALLATETAHRRRVPGTEPAAPSDATEVTACTE